MITTIVLVVMLLLMVAGAPVAFCLILSGALGIYLMAGMPAVLGILTSMPRDSASAYEFLTIPMFLLMAEFVLRSGIADDLFRTAAAWFGRLRGGLGISTALAGAGFGAICGSSTASAATLSSTSLPAMLKYGYDIRMATGVVAISGTLAMLIPPSIAMVVYALLADVSVGKMLIAGVIPGILVTFTIAATVWALAIWRPDHAPLTEPVSLREKLVSLRLVLPMLLLMGAVTGAIYTGITTPTEASAVGALFGGVLYLSRKGWSSREVLDIFSRATRTACMLALIIVGAHIFTTFFALSQTTQMIVNWVAGLDVNRWVIMVALILIIIVLGCFLDQMAILVLFVPILVPLLKTLGFDPIWFGVVMIVTAEVGLVTPPLGLNCFVVARYSNVKLAEVFWGVAPHVVAHMFLIAIMLAFPAISLWLPSQMQ